MAKSYYYKWVDNYTKWQSITFDEFKKRMTDKRRYASKFRIIVNNGGCFIIRRQRSA